MQRKSAALACKRIEGTHSGEAIAAELHRIHELFGLNNEKIVGTITDNGSNFIKAFKLFGLSTSSILEREQSMDNVEECETEQIDDAVGTSDNISINEIDSDNDFGDDYGEDDYYIAEADVDTESINEEINAILPRHLRCASHTLHLIASSDAMKIIRQDSRLKRVHEEAIVECEKLWRKLRSPKNREVLKKYLKCALKRPVVTQDGILCTTV